jgi:hypothetical protein
MRHFWAFLENCWPAKDAYLPSNKSLIERVDAQHILEKGNRPWIAAAWHKLHPKVDGHVYSV